jgi:dolichol kinase
MRAPTSILLVVSVISHVALAHTPFRNRPVLSQLHDRRALFASFPRGGGASDPNTPGLARGGSTKAAVPSAAAAAEDKNLRDALTARRKSKLTAERASNSTSSSVSSFNQTDEDNAAIADHSSPRKKLQLPKFLKKKDSQKRHKQIAKTLKNRNNINVRRKVMHAAFGLTFASLNHWLPRSQFVPGMALLSTATLIMELLRYRKGFGWMNEALHFCLGSSLRKHEMDGKFTGSFYFFTGVTLTAWLYPQKAVATLGMAQLALADPSASYFGRRTRHVYWSRIENGFFGIGRNKGWLGFLGGALFCVPFNYRVLNLAAAAQCPHLAKSVVLSVSLLLGVAGALADLMVPTPALVLPKKILGVRVPPFHIDDNMVVPLFSAFACSRVFAWYGLPQDFALTKWMVI